MKYRRILLKLSGESLGLCGPAPNFSPLDADGLAGIAHDIAQVVQYGVQVGIVIGAGNWFRGVQAKRIGIHRITGDHIGMLGTLMNALALRDVLVSHQLVVKILSAIPVGHFIEDFEWLKAKHYLESGAVVIFGGGTGHPWVSTDAAASLRALEIEADILLKATSVDGVYSADPRRHPEAQYYHEISYDRVIQDELTVMDLAAFIQCREHQLPIRVFNIKRPHSLVEIIQGKSIGTLVSSSIS